MVQRRDRGEVCKERLRNAIGAAAQSVVGNDIVCRVEAHGLRVEHNEKKIENGEHTEKCPRLGS